MKRSFPICALVALLAYSSAAAPFDAPGRSGNGFIDERLDRIDAVVNAEIEKGKIPGAVAIVVRNGQVAYLRSFGYADVESGKPMTSDAIFRIASMTKALTSVGIMILYERGEFLLNDPVGLYLPEFAQAEVVSEVDEAGDIVATTPASRPIRIIDLLTHSAGIGYSFIPSSVSRQYEEAGIIDGLTSNPYTLAEQMQLLAKQPLMFEPGTRFAYGLNTDVLGYLIEVISGKTLAEFFRDEITEPLALRDTHFYLPEDSAGRLVTVYSEVDGEGLVAAQDMELPLTVGSANYPVEGARSYFSGGAGLSSTVNDYARFLQMLLNGGELDGVRILSRKSVELMHTPRIDWDNDGAADFGLGFRVISDIGKDGAVGSNGSYSWGGAFYTSYWIDPSENLVAVFMSQGRPISSNVDEKFRALVYQALE